MISKKVLEVVDDVNDKESWSLATSYSQACH
jgi:hypothetical protein